MQAPVEIGAMIFRHLSYNEITALMFTSKHWYRTFLRTFTDNNPAKYTKLVSHLLLKCVETNDIKLYYKILDRFPNEFNYNTHAVEIANWLVRENYILGYLEPYWKHNDFTSPQYMEMVRLSVTNLHPCRPEDILDSMINKRDNNLEYSEYMQMMNWILESLDKMLNTTVDQFMAHTNIDTVAWYCSNYLYISTNYADLLQTYHWWHKKVVGLPDYSLRLLRLYSSCANTEGMESCLYRRQRKMGRKYHADEVMPHLNFAAISLGIANYETICTTFASRLPYIVPVISVLAEHITNDPPNEQFSRLLAILENYDNLRISCDESRDKSCDESDSSYGGSCDELYGEPYDDSYNESPEW